jgi:hypothetical protein
MREVCNDTYARGLVNELQSYLLYSKFIKYYNM